MDHGLGIRHRPTSSAPRRGVSGDPVVLGAILSRDRNQCALAGSSAQAMHLGGREPGDRLRVCGSAALGGCGFTAC